jgi:hypothetical protein
MSSRAREGHALRRPPIQTALLLATLIGALAAAAWLMMESNAPEDTSTSASRPGPELLGGEAVPPDEEASGGPQRVATEGDGSLQQPTTASSHQALEADSAAAFAAVLSGDLDPAELGEEQYERILTLAARNAMLEQTPLSADPQSRLALAALPPSDRLARKAGRSIEPHHQEILDRIANQYRPELERLSETALEAIDLAALDQWDAGGFRSTTASSPSPAPSPAAGPESAYSFADTMSLGGRQFTLQFESRDHPEIEALLVQIKTLKSAAEEEMYQYIVDTCPPVGEGGR